MVRTRRVGAAVALLMISAAGAQAADMPGTPPPIPVQPVAPIQWLSAGWYLRGDLGYRFGASARGDAPAPFPNASSNELGNAFFGGAGFGIKTRWIRTDVTLDYASPMQYTGTVVAPDDTTAKIQANTALFNGYFDLGTWYRMTPYVGAGAGVSYVRLTDYAGPAPPAANGDHNQWNFAWALMAGLGVPISPNMMVDVGYRYLNLGDVSARNTGAGAMTFRNVAGHEVRVGLRWSFDENRELQ